jgi:hypothetical protein
VVERTEAEIERLSAHFAKDASAMTEEQWAVAVTLSNGETRVLASSTGALEVAKNNLDAFINKRAPFGSDWVAAEHSWVVRTHVVETTLIQVSAAAQDSQTPLRNKRRS